MAKANKSPTNKTRNRFRIDPSIKRTVLLLLLMLIVGSICGTVGYVFARQSLKGITQPATNPFLKESDDLDRRPRQGADFLNEKDLIAKVKSQTSGANIAKEKQKTAPKPKKPKSSDSKEDKKSQPKSLPIKVNNQGMNFEVKSLSREDDTLLLNVALQNSSDKTIQFVYTFLDITDEQGQALFSEIRGLPTEFKPKGEIFFGTIKILDVPPETVEKISISLNDYPDQKVKFDIQNIPVADE
ncbi:hypothetical protein [Acaryochloris sp. CCMEE 5410]|uniref:hypothetical protein n=1 Tax=Acaryochloris sp. CCMEE 5410 TaxID=310037 RepID=UPI001F2C94C1|nr:hypothetical protein [Acaryochloris sp. CCMEE 5410]